MEILLYFSAVMAVTYLFTDTETAISHLWQFIVTMIAYLLWLIGVFSFMEQMEEWTEKKYLTITGKVLNDDSTFNREKSWGDKFMVMFDCRLCAGFWMGIFFSILLGVNLFPQMGWTGHILTGSVATVFQYLFRELFDKALYSFTASAE